MLTGLRAFALFDVALTPAVIVDDSSLVGRRYIPITGGRFSGEIEGRILAGGGDWQLVWPDRLELSAHYILQTTAGATIEVRSNGVRYGAPDVMARLARDEAVDPDSYYFRTALRFTTGAPNLVRLNHMLAVGVGTRTPHGAQLRVFEVL